MLFKFISERPSPSVIWQTLSDTTITPSAGYTVHQIRFMMFIILVMHDFKEAKQICNDFLVSKPAPIFTTTKKYLDVSDSDIKSIAEPPLDLPLFVAEQFYLPYYYLLQLCDLPTNQLWLDLFDRDIVNTEEYNYIELASQELSYSITKYKMWKQLYNSAFLDTNYSKLFTIDMSLPPAEISTKLGIYDRLTDYLNITVDEKLIYDYSEKIIIPPFQLKAPHVSS